MDQGVTDRQTQLLSLLLENRGGLSTEELADRLAISRTAVQRHISLLESKGYVSRDILSKTAGRPVQIYVLTDIGINFFPKQYAWFSELILEELIRQLGPKSLEDQLQRLAQRLAESFHFRLYGKSADQQLQEVSLIMQELGYHARLTAETENGSAEIRACNCVYHELAKKHHEVCKFDLALLSSLLDREVELTECMARGGLSCRFEIKPME